MLTRLSIRNIVLIEALDLEFGPGLCVLTGETGAGKSILLDSLSLVLGARGSAGLVRAGARQAIITASFELDALHPLGTLLEDQGLAWESPLILRRTIGPDGRSRAFVNDQPCSVGMLRQVGDQLLEIHGQFEVTRLFQTSIQRRMLDLFGGLEGSLAQTRAAWQVMQEAHAEFEAARAETRRLSDQRELLTAQVEELQALATRSGEEADLSRERSILLNRAALIEAYQTSLDRLDGEAGAQRGVAQAQKALLRILDRGPEILPTLLAGLERAEAELQEVVGQLRAAADALDEADNRADVVEERLFSLRHVARKHHVSCDELPAVLADLSAKLARIEDQGAYMAKLERSVRAARQAYTQAAGQLSSGRAKAAASLERLVGAELAPLKLDKARFTVRLTSLMEDKWGADGQEEVSFLLATNPGQDPAPLAKAASGGELSRLMLALKVVLADVSGAATLVFDEVDSGIGGATADAVGDRLARLGRSVQVLVVTHSPQVAARGHRHWQVRKVVDDSLPVTDVRPLSPDERREEIARMLSGAEVTAEARAAAARLLAV